MFFGDSELRGKRGSGGHRRGDGQQGKTQEGLLFASLPALFAIHQFIEGFVWLGLDGYLSVRPFNYLEAM